MVYLICLSNTKHTANFGNRLYIVMKLRTFIKKLTPALTVLVAVVLYSFPANAQDDAVAGEKLFNENCASCHQLDGKSIGPALRGVHERAGRTEEWLLKWIKNSPGMISSGDKLAVKLYEENAKQNMTVFANLSDNEIKNILTYIKTAPSVVAKEPTDPGKVTLIPQETEPTNNGVKSFINFLLLFIVIAVIIIIGAVFDVLGLVSRYTGIPLNDTNKINSWIMIIFLVVGMGAVVWEMGAHGKFALISDAASAHGEQIDSMLMTTLWITGAVFVVTQIALFLFAFLYRYNPKRKALFYAHNNTLEFVWTIIPAIALTVLVINGFVKWSAITKKAPKEAENIEVFAYQFGWNVRYAGQDKQLGEFSFNLISGTNQLGLGIKGEYTKLIHEVDSSLKANVKLDSAMHTIPDPTSTEKEEMATLANRISLQKAHLSRLVAMEKDETIFNKKSEDDVILKEIVLERGKPVNFIFRARDVIHSAYSPHFRLQMNCVPGMPTYFWFVPTKTTSEMRNILEDQKFDYYLYCAKICGAAHYNMRIKVRVVESAEYKTWLAEQKPTFGAKDLAIPALEQAPVQDSIKATDSIPAVALLNAPKN